MKKEELISIAKNWIKAWNERDHQALVSMMKEDSSFGQIASVFDPIIKHEQRLIPNLYVSEWFHKKLEIVRELNLSFEVQEIITGDGFVQIKSRLSDGKYVVDFLRVEKDGKIDQINREIDYYVWKGEIV